MRAGSPVSGKQRKPSFRERRAKWWRKIGERIETRGWRLHFASKMPSWLVRRLSKRPKVESNNGWTYKGRKGTPTRYGICHHFTRMEAIPEGYAEAGQKKEILLHVYIKPTSLERKARPDVIVVVSNPFFLRHLTTPLGENLTNTVYVETFLHDPFAFAREFMNSMNLGIGEMKHGEPELLVQGLPNPEQSNGKRQKK